MAERLGSPFREQDLIFVALLWLSAPQNVEREICVGRKKNESWERLMRIKMLGDRGWRWPSVRERHSRSPDPHSSLTVHARSETYLNIIKALNKVLG